jgi:predicted nucleic-acid-binding Zn-ribbon protein
MLVADVKRRSKLANESLDVLEGIRRCLKCGSKRLENSRIQAPGA